MMQRSISISKRSKCSSARPFLTRVWTVTHLYLCRAHLCGFDFNLTYPQQGKFPSVGSPILPTEEFRAAALVNQPSWLLNKRFNALVHGIEAPEAGIVRRESRPTHAEVQAREHKRREWLAKKNSLRHRDLSGRANGTIDPWYGCFLQSEVQDYALNFSLPWSEHSHSFVIQC